MAIFTGILLWDFIGVTVALLAIFYAYFQWCYQYWKKKNVPHMEPKIPFGNMPNPFSKKPTGFIDFVRQIYDEAKSNGWKHYGIYQLTRPIYIAIDVDLIKRIMTKDFNHFVDRGVYVNEKDDPIKANLFALGGQKWRNLRVKLTPTFTSGKLKGMFQTLVNCGLVMEEYIENNISSSDAVDIKDILARFSTDIIGSCAFGLDCNTFKEPDSPFRENAKKLFKSSLFGAIKGILVHSFPIVGRVFHVRQGNQEVTDFYTKVVQDTVKYRLENNYTRNDLLQMLIEMMHKETPESEYKGDGSSLTMNEIIAQCFLFFTAGFETSSTAMTFTLFELATHPDIQEKVRDEIKTVFAKHDGKMTYDSISELKYLRQVIDETLRLYPPVPFVTRQCVEDYHVPDEDLIIEKDTKVFIPIVGLHYDEQNFPKPEIFDPDRFSEENKKKIPRYGYLPFGEGPRVCIGERFGVMQTKVGLASIVRKFKVTLNEKTIIPLKLRPRNFIPAAEGGIWLNLEKL